MLNRKNIDLEENKTALSNLNAHLQGSKESLHQNDFLLVFTEINYRETVIGWLAAEKKELERKGKRLQLEEIRLLRQLGYDI